VLALQQGYPRVQDLTAHICACWEEALQVVPLLRAQHLAEQECDADMFNARAVTRYQTRTHARIEALFEQLRVALVGLIRVLPASAVDDDRVCAWLLRPPSSTIENTARQEAHACPKSLAIENLLHHNSGICITPQHVIDCPHGSRDRVACARRRPAG
jgi:hypothetical protein